MNDVEALIHLVTHPSYINKKPIIDLINNSKKPIYKIIANDSPFESKDILKANNYWWNAEKKYWWKKIIKEEIEDERKWLSINIYKGYFLGSVVEILIQDKYKE